MAVFFLFHNRALSCCFDLSIYHPKQPVKPKGAMYTVQEDASPRWRLKSRLRASADAAKSLFRDSPVGAALAAARNRLARQGLGESA